MKFNEIDIEKLKVSGDRVLIRKERPEQKNGYSKTEAGVLYAENTEIGEKEPDNIGEVVDVGPDVMNRYLIENDNLPEDYKEKLDNMGPPTTLLVIHQPFAGFSFVNGKYDYSILSEQEILAVL